MSKREQAYMILDSLPERYIAQVLGYLQGVASAAQIDDADDEEYCCALIDRYLADPDRDQFVTEAELLKELGLSV